MCILFLFQAKFVCKVFPVKQVSPQILVIIHRGLCHSLVATLSAKSIVEFLEDVKTVMQHGQHLGSLSLFWCGWPSVSKENK